MDTRELTVFSIIVDSAVDMPDRVVEIVALADLANSHANRRSNEFNLCVDVLIKGMQDVPVNDSNIRYKAILQLAKQLDTKRDAKCTGVADMLRWAIACRYDH